TYTNIDGVDDDIEIRPLLRMCTTQQKRWIHRFQHIYVWVLYSLLLIFWVFMFDYRKYFRNKVGNIPIKKFSPTQHVTFWAAKVFYYAIMILIPVLWVGWVNWLVGFLVITMFAGVVLSVVFQLAHTVEDTAFPVPTENNDIENEWAIHQVQTTANFATKNKLICWLVGGLNFQIEHHLFPKISHVHYPAISEIVKRVCAEYQLQYIEYPTMRQAVSAHVRFLRRMGKYD
ncbi:MAG: fatty acid desaturase family protein, partial [Bacteroidota bacterium]